MFPYAYSEYSISAKIYKTLRQDYGTFTLVYYQDVLRANGGSIETRALKVKTARGRDGAA
jgi:hypothetical protein